MSLRIDLVGHVQLHNHGPLTRPVGGAERPGHLPLLLGVVTRYYEHFAADAATSTTLFPTPYHLRNSLLLVELAYLFARATVCNLNLATATTIRKSYNFQPNKFVLLQRTVMQLTPDNLQRTCFFSCYRQQQLLLLLLLLLRLLPLLLLLPPPPLLTNLV